MKNQRTLTYFAFILFVSAGTLAAQTIRREVARTNEKEAKVYLSSTFGSVHIEKGDPGKIVEVYYRRDKDDNEPKLDFDYYIQRNTGELRIEMNPHGAKVIHSRDGEVNVNLDHIDLKTDEWHIKLTDEIPLSIDAELGAGKSDFNFTGLEINDLTISTGASSSKMRFDKKNKGEIDHLSIETGVSKFVAENLNNAQFRKMTFEGGVGSYYLDFGGELKRTVDVTVNVGLGAITVVVPERLGVRIKYEDSWLSNFTIDDEFVRKKKGTYESENYDDAEGRMNIYIESGLGSVKIKRSNDEIPH